MFGYNIVTLDAKGRISVPARYREDFVSNHESQIIVTKDPQYPSLKVYPGKEWKNISSTLQSLQGLDPIVRNIQWTILGNAHESKFDVGGRMLIRIPQDLRQYAEIFDDKQIVLIGMGNKFEIWNIKNWEMRQMGGSLSTEILDVVLPESIKSMSF